MELFIAGVVGSLLGLVIGVIVGAGLHRHAVETAVRLLDEDKK